MTASQDPLLFQIQGNAETLSLIVTALPQILGYPDSSVIHSIIQQLPKSALLNDAMNVGVSAAHDEAPTPKFIPGLSNT